MYLVRKFYSPESKENGATEEKPSETKPEKETSEVALAKALKEARENSVSKEEYDRVVKEKEQLVSEIINGEGKAGNGQQTPPEEADIEALRTKLYGPKASELSNLEYAKTALELRNAVIKVVPRKNSGGISQPYASYTS